MHLEYVRNQFVKLGRDGLEYRILPGASRAGMNAAERRLGVSFPTQVRLFYGAVDGIEVVDPPFKLYALSEMKRDGPLLEFCLCHRVHRLAFDTVEINNAGQWFIVNAETGYRITSTMASFWSIRMWTWIEKRRPIWYDFYAEWEE